MPGCPCRGTLLICPLLSGPRAEAGGFFDETMRSHVVSCLHVVWSAWRSDLPGRLEHAAEPMPSRAMYQQQLRLTRVRTGASVRLFTRIILGLLAPAFVTHALERHKWATAPFTINVSISTEHLSSCRSSE